MNHEALLALLSELYVNLSQTNAKLQTALARIAELEKAVSLPDDPPLPPRWPGRDLDAE